MIPNPWLILGGIGIALGLIVGSYMKGRGDGAESVRAEMRVLVDARNAEVEKLEQAAQVRVDQLETSYANQIAQLDRRYRDAARRIGPVRVQQCPHRSGLPEAAKGPGVSADPTGRDGLSETAGRDIGPDLVELARVADRQTQQLIACQDYAREVQRLSE